MEMTDNPKLETTARSKRTNSEHEKGEDSSQKRAKIAVEAPLKKEPDGLRRSSQFYYSDGTLIVIVGGVEYRLHLYRWMKHCDLFSDLYGSDLVEQFERVAARADDADDIRSNRSLCGNPVAQAKAVDSTKIPRYEIKNITVADFTVFLCAFENPLMHTIAPCSQSTAVSLLRVATKLGCGTVHKMAKHRLCSLWPHTAPSNSRRRKNLNETTDIIAVAHELNLPEFYYADGNIIVIVEDMEFCLHLSRLMKHCTLFSRLWELVLDEPEDQQDTTLVDSVAGAGHRELYGVARVTIADAPAAKEHVSEPSRAEEDQIEDATSTKKARHTLKGIKAADFTAFLPAFENPLMYTAQPPNHIICISLVRVADKLGCTTVSDVAKSDLCKMWPRTAPQRDEWTEKPLNDLIAIIALARQFHIHEILKSAWYDVFRTPSFWTTIVTDRDSVKLADVDLLTLYHARHVLQQEWRALVLTPPMPNDMCIGSRGISKGCIHTEPATRSEKWRSQFIDSLETGAIDPICYIDVLLARFPFINPDGTWCARCLAERRRAWTAARVRWWEMLDELFKIPAAEGNAS